MKTLQFGLIAVALFGCKRSDTSLSLEDRDDDGYAAGEDCNDEDGTVFPGAEEVCDGLDNDCDGEVETRGVYYADADADGFGDAGSSEEACAAPEGFVENDLDCDDADAQVNPDGQERCNTIDDDCDGQIDEEDALGQSTWYGDTDGDEYGDPLNATDACEQPIGFVADDQDCDDTDPDVSPEGVEYCNGEDDDCNGLIDDGDLGGNDWFPDVDGDGFGDDAGLIDSCEQPPDTVAVGGDCDDATAAINPDATELCNNIDDDCDGLVDDGLSGTATWYADADGDGFGDAASAISSCLPPSGYVSNSDDCDDAASTTYPGASEVCDGVDNDCDTIVDDDPIDPPTWYGDSDGDGYGDPSMVSSACETPVGYVANDEDCDPSDGSINPGAAEYCDGEDENCDGLVDNDAIDGDWYYPDADGDGFGSAIEEMACDGADNDLDCDDANPAEPFVVDAASGSSSGAGTLASPLASVQDGIDMASQCVVVYPGTYNEDIDFGGKNLSVVGAEGAETTVLDGTGSGAVVTFDSGETSAAQLRGFTITGGTGRLESSSEPYSCSSVSTCTNHYSIYCGGGIVVDGADPTLTDLIVDGNTLPAASSSSTSTDNYYTYSYGGGVCLLGSTSTLTGVDIQENYADQGGALYVDDVSNVEFTQSFVTANTATDGGAFEVDGGVLTLVNVVSSWNEADDDGGGVLVIDGTLYATNVTHGGDDATSGGGIYLSGASAGTVMNTAIWGAATGVGVLVDSSSTWTGTYNDVFGNAGGRYSGITDPTGTSGNISALPGFTSVSADGNPWNDTWTLTTASPLVNAGTTTASYNDVDGSRNDIGAFGGPGGGW